MTVTAAQKKATAKYEKEKYDKILVRLPKGTKERIQSATDGSVNGFITQAIEEKLREHIAIDNNTSMNFDDIDEPPF